jgi:hypothetical protein
VEVEERDAAWTVVTMVRLVNQIVGDIGCPDPFGCALEGTTVANHERTRPLVDPRMEKRLENDFGADAGWIAHRDCQQRPVAVCHIAHVLTRMD